MVSKRGGHSQGERERLPMFILDVLKYDIENIDSVLNLLNDKDGIGWRFAWPRDFERQEVVSALQYLLRMGLIEALTVDPSEQVLIEAEDKGKALLEDPDAYWFQLTELGRRALENWTDYPTEPETE